MSNYVEGQYVWFEFNAIKVEIPGFLTFSEMKANNTQQIEVISPPKIQSNGKRCLSSALPKTQHVGEIILQAQYFATVTIFVLFMNQSRNKSRLNNAKSDKNWAVGKNTTLLRVGEMKAVVQP